MAPFRDDGTWKAPSISQDDKDLVFLRDEGLELLAAFKRIRDERQRYLLMELVRTMADGQPGADGG